MTDKATAARLAPAAFLLLWAAGYSVAKVGTADADPLTLLSLRFGLALLILTPVWIVLRPSLPRSWRAWRDLLVVGVLMQAVHFGCVWLALDRGGSTGTVALITCLYPIVVALAMPLMSAERVSARRWAGLCLGLAGAAMVLIGNHGVQTTSVQAILLAVAGLLAFSSATLWEKQYGVEHHPVTANLVQYAAGFVVVLPVAWYLEPMQIILTPALAWSLAYLVLCNSLLAISLLLWLIRRGEATRVSALFFLVPPLAALIAWFLLGEVMTPVAWGGMFVAAGGVWLATRRAA